MNLKFVVSDVDVAKNHGVEYEEIGYYECTLG